MLPRLIYLLLAIAGALIPMTYFIEWLSDPAQSFMTMIDAWGANAATTGLMMDLSISALTAAIWMIIDSSARRDRRALIALPMILLIGLSCGLPLYLYLRRPENESAPDAPDPDSPA